MLERENILLQDCEHALLTIFVHIVRTLKMRKREGGKRDGKGEYSSAGVHCAVVRFSLNPDSSYFGAALRHTQNGVASSNETHILHSYTHTRTAR